jgi:hypothetical protein
MQVLCKISKNQGEVRCRICGQGFLVYWARTSRTERDAARQQIVEALAAQHADSDSEQVHPRTGFTVPSWPGAPAFSGAALLGGAQGWSI